MEVNLLGDAKVTLTALLEHLTPTQDLKWQEGIVAAMESWNEVTEAVAKAKAEPINPRLVFHELNERLPENCIVTADAGTTADWYGHHIKLGANMMGNLSGLLASMLAAMPYAVAAKFAYPDRPVICTIGDGAFQMLGMNELLTVKRHWQEWADPRFIVMVLHNNDLAQVSFEMREAGDPKYEASQTLPDMDYAGYAELLGFRGIRVDDPTQVGAAWDAALAADRPVLLDIWTDPNVPPLPAHITVEQATGFVQALLKRDPSEGPLIKEAVRAVGAELFAKARHAVRRDS